jgi:hypothetical protein
MLDEATRQTAEAIKHDAHEAETPRPAGPLWRLWEAEPTPYRPEPAPARPAPRQAAPAPAKPAAWVRAFDALEAAVGSALGLQRRAAEWRFAEAERRIGDLERRLAEMEKAGGGDA